MRVSGGGLRNSLRGWVRQHGYSFLYSLGNLLRHPLASLMTALVIGLALTLPLMLWTSLLNLDGLRQMDSLEQISAFVTTADVDAGATDEKIRRLGSQLMDWPEVIDVTSISPHEGLQTLDDQAGFAAIIDLVDRNPLPWVLVITPQDSSAEQVNLLLERLQALPELDYVQADIGWLRRLSAILQFIQKLTQLVAVLFSLGVLLVVSNTIRLDIQNRQDEIDVLSLAGATPGFIRRPFLYTGFWYAAAGGVISIVLLLLGVALVSEDFARLTSSYEQARSISLPGAPELALVVVVSGVTGLAGAWLAVSRRLRRLQR